MIKDPKDTQDDGGIEGRRPQIAASGGKSYHEIMRDTDKVIEKHMDNYIRQLEKDIKKLKKLAPKYEKDPSADNLKPLFALVHNMRGQGTLFGYPLVTDIGGHFCRYIDSMPEYVAPRKDVSILCIQALQLIQREDVKGTNDERYQELSDAMRHMVDHLLRKAHR